jgi:hypothetical protein
MIASPAYAMCAPQPLFFITIFNYEYIASELLQQILHRVEQGNQ